MRPVYHVKNKAFKLSGKAKYCRHTGNNNNFFEKWNKAKVKRYLANKSTDAGGDICERQNHRVYRF